MTKKELAIVLDKHKKWMNEEEDGELADLRNADLRNADLRNADLRHADLRHADLRHAELCYADLRNAELCYADMRGANLDYSCWPIWCGSLRVHICERIALQLLYHALYNIAYSKHISAEIKRVLLKPEIVDIANRSHVVHKHSKPKIEPYKEET